MLNYSNPASIVAEACRRFKPNSRVINICDMPIGMEHTIARILGFKSRKEMCIRYYGLNHFGWWTSIKDKDGKEYIQDLIKHQLKYGNCLADDDASNYTDSSWFDTAKKVKDIIAIDQKDRQVLFSDNPLLESENVGTIYVYALAADHILHALVLGIESAQLRTGGDLLTHLHV